MPIRPTAEGRAYRRVSQDISRFLAGSILRQPSSVELGWANFAVERRTIVPSEFSELALDKHFLILWKDHIAEGEHSFRAGQFTAYKKYPDTITTCHPGIRAAIRNRSSHEVIVAVLEPDFITSIGQELDVQPRVPLQDLHGAGDPDLNNLIQLLHNESGRGGRYGTLYKDSLTAALAIRLMSAAPAKNFAGKTISYVLPDRVLKRVVERMHVDLHTDLDLSTLAAESGYSRAHFLRTFKATTGQTPHRYLTELRLQKAEALLVAQSLRLVDIAAACGFSSQAHLSTAFAARFGMPPGEYRRAKITSRTQQHVQE